MRPVELRTPRLVLRPARMADVPALVAAANDKAVARYTRVPHPYTRAHARKYVRVSAAHRGRGSGFGVLITLGETGEIVGTIGLGNLDRRTRKAELGYWVARKHWNQGIAREAVRAMVAHGFGPLDLQRIVAYVLSPNGASARVLERCGFQLEGTLRRHSLVKGRWLDLLVYAKLKGASRRRSARRGAPAPRSRSAGPPSRSPAPRGRSRAAR